MEWLLEGDSGRQQKLEKRQDIMVAKVVFYGWIGNSYVHYALFCKILVKRGDVRTFLVAEK